MHIEARPWHFDGRNANRWEPVLRGDEAAFTLVGDGWESGPHRWDDLVALDVGGRGRVFAHRAIDGWRMGFGDDPPADLRALLPAAPRHGRWIDKIGFWPAVGVTAVLSVALIAVVARAPAFIAPLIPQSAEDAFGDALLGDFGGRYCQGGAGQAALRTLVAKIDPLGHARTVEVANIAMPNAVALPGRHIIIFRGLIEQAGSADEVAGVLGHELGHVTHRHTMAGLLRQLGLGVVLGGVSLGDQVNTLVSMSFSREAEHEADVAALAALDAANISPAPTAGFFRRMGGGENKDAGTRGTGDNWLASHPSSLSREQVFAKAVKPDRRYSPALSAADWFALRSICAQDKDVKSGWNSSL